MASKSEATDRVAKQVAKCKRCGLEVGEGNEFYDKMLKSGLCPYCALELARSADLRFEQDVSSYTVSTVNLSGMLLSEGDTVEVVVGRNKTVIGKFKAWNPRLYTIVIETNDGTMLIPYKYVKLLLKR